MFDLRYILSCINTAKYSFPSISKTDIRLYTYLSLCSIIKLFPDQKTYSKFVFPFSLSSSISNFVSMILFCLLGLNLTPGNISFIFQLPITSGTLLKVLFSN